MTVIQKVNPDEFKVLEKVMTLKSARTIVIDKKTHYLFLITAESEDSDPSTSNSN